MRWQLDALTWIHTEGIDAHTDDLSLGKMLHGIR